MSNDSGRETKSVQGTYEESPLLFGVAALACGLGAGLLFGPTRREREVVGPLSDRLVIEARRAVRKGGDRLVDELVRSLLGRRS